jgi:hypothetical protein
MCLQDLDLLNMCVSQMKAGWVQVKQNLDRKQEILRLAPLLLGGLVFILLAMSFLSNIINGLNDGLSAHVVPVINIPLYVVVWSAIGSCSAVLYRVNRTNDIELEDPKRLLITQPFIGMMMGTVSYLVVHLCLITLATDTASSVANVSGNLASSAKTTFFFSLISFLVGFSDRFADSLLHSLVSRFGDDKTGELMNSSLPVDQAGTLVLKTFMDAAQSSHGQMPTNSWQARPDLKGGRGGSRSRGKKLPKPSPSGPRRSAQRQPSTNGLQPAAHERTPSSSPLHSAQPNGNPT